MPLLSGIYAKSNTNLASAGMHSHAQDLCSVMYTYSSILSQPCHLRLTPGICRVIKPLSVQYMAINAAFAPICSCLQVEICCHKEAAAVDATDVLTKQDVPFLR